MAQGLKESVRLPSRAASVADARISANRGMLKAAETKTVNHVEAGQDNGNEGIPTGLVAGAINRIENLTSRVRNITAVVEGNCDRLLSSRDNSERGTSAAPTPDGEANRMHFELSLLENAIEELDYQSRRIADL